MMYIRIHRWTSASLLLPLSEIKPMCEEMPLLLPLPFQPRKADECLSYEVGKWFLVRFYSGNDGKKAKVRVGVVFCGVEGSCTKDLTCLFHNVWIFRSSQFSVSSATRQTPRSLQHKQAINQPRLLLSGWRMPGAAHSFICRNHDSCLHVRRTERNLLTYVLFEWDASWTSPRPRFVFSSIFIGSIYVRVERNQCNRPCLITASVFDQPGHLSQLPLMLTWLWY